MALKNDQARRKRAWTQEEDMKLVEYVHKHGEGNWKSVGKTTGLDRNEKSCRLRWANHLKPDIKKGAFSEEEKQLIIELHANIGNKWSLIAAQLPGRTDNEIKNFWNGRMRRKHPEVLTLDNKNVHQPKQQLNSSGPSYPSNNPYRSSRVGLSNIQENQYVPVPTYMSHQSEHLQSKNKNPFLNSGSSDSVPVSSTFQFGPSNFRINSYPNVEPAPIHTLLGFTPAPATASSSHWRITSNGTITSTDNQDIKVHENGTTNILGDELMSLIDSSPSSGPIPEWSELGYY